MALRGNLLCRFRSAPVPELDLCPSPEQLPSVELDDRGACGQNVLWGR